MHQQTQAAAVLKRNSVREPELSRVLGWGSSGLRFSEVLPRTSTK